MDSFEGLVLRLIRCLNDSTVDYAFTGAFAVSFYGSPRTTHDVDLMVAVGNDDVSAVAETLRCASIDADDRKIREATKSGYNIVTLEDKLSSFSVDVILSSDKLEKRSATIYGLETYLQQPEGLILAKLRMIKATIPRERALKDEDDVKGILRFTKVNLESIKRRAIREGTFDILENLLNQT